MIISGQLLTKVGGPVQWATITFDPANGEAISFQTDFEGKYSQDIPVGSYRVTKKEKFAIEEELLGCDIFVLRDSDIEELLESPDYDSYAIDIRQFGGKCDAVKTVGALVTQGSYNIEVPSVIFTDVDIGKLLYVAGIGVGGTCLCTRISSVVSSTIITMQNPAEVSCTSAHIIYGNDDTQAWADAFSYIGDNKSMTINIPYGQSLTDGVVVKTNQQIRGCNGDGWAFRNQRRSSGLLIKPDSKMRGAIQAFSGSVGNVELSNLFIDGAFRFRTNAILHYNGATTIIGSNIVTFSNGTFTASDVGKTICVFGAGVGGALQESGYIGIITAVTDSNTITVLDSDNPATKAVSNAAYVYGFYDQYGTDGVSTASSYTFSAASANFTSNDVGKAIDIFEVMAPTWGDGTLNRGDGKGEFLSCHITSVLSPTSVTLSTKPELNLTGVRWRMGFISGVYQQEAPISQDSMWHFDRVNISVMSGHGYVMSNWQRAQRINRTNFWQCLGFGLLALSSDNVIDQTMAACCGMDGFYTNQSTTRFVNIDSFLNEGNGMYFGGYGSMCTMVGASIDMNGKNGICSFAKGTRLGTGTRFTSNSQKKHGAYSDFTICRRVNGGVTNLNKPGCTYEGVFHERNGGNTVRPKYGVDSVGPYAILGLGVQYDPDNVDTFQTSRQTSGVVFGLGYNTTLSAGSTLSFSDNNTLSFGGGGTKIGASPAEKLSFYGSSTIVKPTVTGAKSGNVALTSLITQLATLGLIIDSTT